MPAIHKMTALIKKVQGPGGLKPRGSGNRLRAPFKYGNKEYRIDLEIHGDDDANFLA